MRSAVLAVATAMLVLVAGCKRSKPLFVQRVWLGPSTGCVGSTPHPTLGTMACWGANESGQIGDGTRTSRPAGAAFSLKEGAIASLALGARHACAVVDRHKVYCWGDGAEGPTPTEVESDPTRDLEVATGGGRTCIWGGRRIRCFGAGRDPEVWTRAADIRAVAVGDAHTCVAYAAGESAASVECRGAAMGATGTVALEGANVTSLAAGGAHTCALLEDRTVKCWGRNDAGQLGDGTTTDSARPVTVVGVSHVLQVVAGSRHTCVRLATNLVSCWGDNSRHQLANGTTQSSSRAVALHGLLGVVELASAGDSACARLGDGYVRCWGANDRGQLGDLSTVEHDVPMPVKFR